MIQVKSRNVVIHCVKKYNKCYNDSDNKKEPGGSVLARLLSILVFTHTDFKFENM